MTDDKYVKFHEKWGSINPLPEKWTTLIQNGEPNPYYSISTAGRLVTHQRRVQRGRVLDPDYKHVMSPYIKFNKDGSIANYWYKIKVPGQSKQKRLYAHRGVLESFVEFGGDNISKAFAEALGECEWTTEDVPKPLLKLFGRLHLCNHIDHHPENNHLYNLEYETHQGNSDAAIKQYGGDMRNKGKIIPVNFVPPMPSKVVKDQLQTSLLNFIDYDTSEIYRKGSSNKTYGGNV